MKILYAGWILLTTSLLGWNEAISQRAVYNEINNLLHSTVVPTNFDVLAFHSVDIRDQQYHLDGLEKGSILDIKPGTIEQLFNSRQDLIRISIPINERSAIIVLLKRNEIFTSDFALYSSSDSNTPLSYTPGLHFKGIIEGDPTSIVALSVFHDHIMGLIANNEGNFVLGRIKGDIENRHIFYNDKDLHTPFSFECGTIDEGLSYTNDQLENLSHQRDVSDCVRLFLEVDNDLVVALGGATQAADFATGLYNQDFILFANESINMMINGMRIWTTVSPYTGSDIHQMLSSFQANTGFFNGDLSMLISWTPQGGKAAGANGICNVDPDQSKCYAGIAIYYSNVPTYSFSVEYSTHELGHLLGSRHTHACVWNGNNTAIDGCAAPEGNCPLGPIPTAGTIMSYCQNVQGVGIDFNLGFGPQPGNVIRNVVNAAGNCLVACGPVTSYCVSNGTGTNNKYIKQVVLGAINNLTGSNNGYGNYLSKSTNLTSGSANTISLTPGNNGSTKYWRVWIDYNGDNDFDDASELVGQKTGSQVVSISFTVPAGTTPISTRMRVTESYNAYVTSCAVFSDGEVEDYTVNVINPPIHSENSKRDITAWYPDYDHDNYLNPNITIYADGSPGAGWSMDYGAFDCNDNNEYALDCDQGMEVCNGVDDDGDGLVDGDDPDVIGIPWYADADGDGYGDGNTSIWGCSLPPAPGYLPWPNNTDCDDTNPALHPGVTEILNNGLDDDCDGTVDNEICNGLDDDNDGLVDEGVFIGWHPDYDGDGYPSYYITIYSCSSPSLGGPWYPDGYSYEFCDHEPSLTIDCENNPEYCDGVDNDGDGLVDADDTDVQGIPWYLDADGDGQGLISTGIMACSEPPGPGYVPWPNVSDCDDNDPNVQGPPWYFILYYDSDGDGFVLDDCKPCDAGINPAAQEICDGIDNDCDGLIDDEDDSCAGLLIWYQDNDNDGYGNPDIHQTSCSQPEGYVGTGTDCDDFHSSVNPDAPEIMDGLDNDCDGLVNEGLNQLNIEAGDCAVVYYGYAPEACKTLTATVSGGATPYTYAWSNGGNTASISICPTTTTIYSITVTDHNGVSAEDNVTVQVIDVRCGNNYNKVTICHYPPNNAANHQTLCVNASAVPDHLSHGDVLGTCDAPNPCGESNNNYSITPSLLSPYEDNGKKVTQNDHSPEEDMIFNIIPNPANDAVTLKFNSIMKGKLKIISLAGKEIFSREMSENPIQIETGPWAAGLYMVRIETESMVAIKQLVILHN